MEVPFVKIVINFLSKQNARPVWIFKRIDNQRWDLRVIRQNILFVIGSNYT